MCGIAGYYGKRPPSDEAIRSCLALMARRGPDATGKYAHSFADHVHVRLLHSRLSILDLGPRANQPFTRDDRTLVFNGEIYNYREVRRKLERDGVVFDTNSDTEVLSRCLAMAGTDGLNSCEGMWAFAWYDEATGVLRLCRDRFGEKPLYVWERGEGVYFGSEPKFLFALAGGRPTVNMEHLYRFMVHGFRTLYKGTHCFFKQLRLLRQASVLKLDPAGGSQESLFWSPREGVEPDMSYEEAVAGVRDLMLDAVQLRLRADVPLSFCMSGGVDSNVLISIAKRIFGFDVHGFTFTSGDVRYDEMSVIKQSVKELDIRHTLVTAQTENFIPRLRELLVYHDAPVHTVTWYANWLLMEAIAGSGYKISTSGIGADEMFSGYFDHHLAYLYDMRSLSEVYDLALADWKKYVQPLVRDPVLRNPRLYIDHPEFRGHLIQDEGVFAKFLREPWSEPYTETWFSTSLMRNRMLNELFHETVPVYTHEEDLNAMYFSVENRSPYLDRPLFDFCQSVPTRYLVRGGRAKVLLRDAMRGIAPDCVLDCHRKVGFNAPILAFLDVDEPQTRQALLADNPVYEHIRRDRIEAIIKEPELTNAQSKFLFAFLNTKLFLDEYA